MTKITKTFKKLSATVLCTTLLCGAYINTANAGLIQADYAISGDNLAVQDESTGLIWLDLSQTDGMTTSVAQSSFDDYHLATKVEFDTLFDSFFTGFTLDDGKSYSSDATDISLVNGWLGLFGETKDFTNNKNGKRNISSLGMITNADAIFSLGAKYTITLDETETATIYNSATVKLNGSTVEEYSSSDRGWYMVKNVADNDPVSVPEPSILVLFGLALSGLGARRFSK